MKVTEQGVTMNKIYIENETGKHSPHRKILDRIPLGEDNAVSMRDLARGLNETEREIRFRIQKARIDGNVIAGTDAGIFIPETEGELREYVNRTQSRIDTSVATLKPARELLGGLCDE